MSISFSFFRLPYLFGAIGAMVFVSSPVSRATPAVSFNNNAGSTAYEATGGSDPGGISAGWSFTTGSQSTTVGALDADIQSDFVAGMNHVTGISTDATYHWMGSDVRLFTLNNGVVQVVATAHVTINDAVDGNFFSHPITPVVLQPNTTYYLVEDLPMSYARDTNGYYISAEYYINANTPAPGAGSTNYSIDPSITFGQPLFKTDPVAAGSNGANPINSGQLTANNGIALFGPDFNILTVPEPSTQVTMIIGAGGLLAAVCFRRTMLKK